MIEKLKQNGVLISPQHSEKRFISSLGSIVKEYALPFQNPLLENQNVCGYLLRSADAQVELILDDHYKSIENHPGTIGGPVTLEKGVICTITLADSYALPKVMTNIQEIVRDHYHPVSRSLRDAFMKSLASKE